MHTRCTGRCNAGVCIPVLALMLYCVLLFQPRVSVAAGPKRKNIALPGLVINFEKCCIDVDGIICLNQGALELLACTKGTKEHESLVSIKACALHIHTALLLLGAKPGNPLMHRPVDKEGNRWIAIPPRGDPVKVSLLFKNSDGKTTEHALRKFVTRREGNGAGITEKKDSSEEDAGFPDTFLFAGSHLRDNGPGPRKYLADASGNVVSIASFGDELLCLPGRHAHANGALMWQVNSATLPKVGTKVTLRLRPQLKKTKTATSSKTQ